MHRRDAAASAYLTLIRSLCPFSSRLLPLSHSLAESPLPSPPPVSLSCHHPPTSQTTFKCRAATLWHCVPCAASGGCFLHARLRLGSQLETPSITLHKPHLLLLPSFHISAIGSTCHISFPDDYWMRLLQMMHNSNPLILNLIQDLPVKCEQFVF